MNKAFWQGKRVFLTGHTGFKGGWLSLWLSSLGAEATGYALAPSTQPNLFECAGIAKVVRSHIADIRNYDQLAAALKAARPEVVIHMAAQPLVRYSYANPRETYETNVMGTVNLLDAIRQVDSVRAVVIVTSDKCYENREWAWGYRENEPMGGHDPYSNSKGCAELVTAAMRDSFFASTAHAKHGVAVASARAGNVIGGGDWSEDRLIPDMVRAVASGQPVMIRNPAAIRPWQHVLEPLGGYLLLAEKLCTHGPEFASGWNFGPSEDEARTVSWIVEELTQRWAGATWKLDAGKHPHEAHYLKLDSSRARTLLGWKPRLSIAKTMDLLVNWYLAHGSGENMGEFTLQQLSAYIEL